MAKTHSFNMLLDPEDHARLVELAAREKTSAAQVMRSALEARLSMGLDQKPKCATGAPCFVAHMHPMTTNPQPPKAA